jgi:hypothetical protein
MTIRGPLYIALFASCGGAPKGGSGVTSTAATSEASSQQLRAQVTAEGACVTAIVIVDGAEKGSICTSAAAAKGLVVVDLTDTWTPTLFAPTADGQVPSFHDRYLALANERDENSRPLEGEDALDELYGVVPALAIVHTRLADDSRHACHAAIDPKPILVLDHPFSQDDKQAVVVADASRTFLATQLDKERVRRKLADATPLATDPAWAVRYAKWKKLDDQHTALVVAEQELRCEGWLIDKDTDGSFTWRTGNAVELFQRRNFLMPTEKLDQETREAMQLGSRELDFRLALRILRERVVDATGLVEDGTANAGPQPILGRMLDPEAMRAARGHEQPLPESAGDLISAATEKAARELGWTDPERVKAFLDRHAGGTRVALALPPAPAYHAAHMELSVEIDRGDVFYDDQPPLFRHIVAHRPSLVLYVDDRGTKRPLVRWPTTIGGWADQRLADGSLVQRWKESEVGPRVWRDLFAGPTWLPPRTTPDRDLVKNLWNGHWGLKTEVFGPGPHAAYGMMLLEHLQVIKLKDNTERLDDNGIGTHGSASVTSIVNGTSHGCHRLYNQLAVRLGDFLLRHRTHLVKGEQTVDFRRNVFHNDEFFKAKIDTRGFLYELTPPVPVDVTKGNIVSKRKVPPALLAPAHP